MFTNACMCLCVVLLSVIAAVQWVAEERPAGAPSLLPGARTHRHGNEPGCYWCLCSVWSVNHSSVSMSLTYICHDVQHNSLYWKCFSFINLYPLYSWWQMRPPTALIRLKDRLVSAFRWRVHTGPFPLGLCREEYCFHGSGRPRLLHSEPSDPISLLLEPLVRDWLNPSLLKEHHIKPSHDYFLHIFFLPSGYQTTGRHWHVMRMKTWQQRGRESIMDGARQTSCRSLTSLR